jgi:small-conductance mechanosensitive channel
MSTSFTELVNNIWNSLDDILVCVGVFLVTHIFASGLRQILRVYFHLGAWISQSAQFLVLFSVLVFLAGHLLGVDTAISLFSGFSIGLGYALQPYIISLLAGGTLYASGLLRRGDRLHINDNTMVVESIGLLYVSAKNDKLTTYLPNAMLSSRPFSILRES